MHRAEWPLLVLRGETLGLLWPGGISGLDADLRLPEHRALADHYLDFLGWALGGKIYNHWSVYPNFIPKYRGFL